jgi:hypothetical protein
VKGSFLSMPKNSCNIKVLCTRVRDVSQSPRFVDLKAQIAQLVQYIIDRPMLYQWFDLSSFDMVPEQVRRRD